MLEATLVARQLVQLQPELAQGAFGRVGLRACSGERLTALELDVDEPTIDRSRYRSVAA